MNNGHQSDIHAVDWDQEAFVEMPRPTTAPMMAALGLTVLSAGIIAGIAFLAVGSVLLCAALSVWLGELLPGSGHVLEPRMDLARRPKPILGQEGTVEQLRPGMPGYRFRLPEKVHSISAGIRGGLVGGMVMPIPAFIYGILSGHGIWFPINLLSGMMLPQIGDMAVPELEQFHISLFLLGLAIHVLFSVVLGMGYGVLLPTLPVGRAPLWGGLLLPLLWTGASYGLMGVVNPVLQQRVEWFWFIVSQFVFGIVAGMVIIRCEKIQVAPVGSGKRT